MSRRPFHLYPATDLPDGFRYPKELVEIARTGETPDFYPWWFIDASSEAGVDFWALRNHDGRNLVPFAKVDADLNDVACFDGNDKTGDPKVLMLILDDSQREYEFQSFSVWLQESIEYSSKLRRWLGKVPSVKS